MAAETSVDHEKKKKKKGGLKTMPFILATDACDRFAILGFNTNMISYLIQQMHMPLVQASKTLNNFKGTSSLTPIVGGLIADAYAGRFWTITAGSIIYNLGMLSLTVSASLPALRPPPCAPPEKTCREASSSQLLVLYMSLLLTSIGTGGIRPCVVAFGADQFELDANRNKPRKWDFFNLYFFTMGCAELLAYTVVIYIQENVSWGWGLGVPTMAMGLSVITFVLGYQLYIITKPAGSPLTRLAQVVVAAVRKRKTAKPRDSSLLYENKELDAHISTAGRLLHTNQLVFFDRAAIVKDGDVPVSGRPRLWRLATVHRVEELKSIVRLLPIWVVSVMFITSATNNHGFAIQQARTMDRHLSRNFQVPPATLSIFSTIATMTGLAIYDRAFVPVARRFTGKPAGITFLQRWGIGLGIGLFANVAAALVEVKRKAVAARHGLLDSPKAMIPISVFWLVPQHAIHGLAEAFTQAAHMEFLYDQAPESMRSMAAALYWLSISVGSYMGTFLVTLVHGYSARRREDWLQDNINRGKLDYYYWLVTGIQVINLGYFILCAVFYTFKPLEVLVPEDPVKPADEEGGAGEMELAAVDAPVAAQQAAKALQM